MYFNRNNISPTFSVFLFLFTVNSNTLLIIRIFVISHCIRISEDMFNNLKSFDFMNKFRVSKGVDRERNIESIVSFEPSICIVDRLQST